MARISTYSLDTTVNPDDIIIGSDSAASNVTKNFKASTFAAFAETNAEVAETLTRTLTVLANTLYETPPATVEVETLIKGSLVHFETHIPLTLLSTLSTGTIYQFTASFSLPMESFEPKVTHHLPASITVESPYAGLSSNAVSLLTTYASIQTSQGEGDTFVYLNVRMSFSSLVGSTDQILLSGTYII